jgi:hypothetical protein
MCFEFLKLGLAFFCYTDKDQWSVDIFEFPNEGLVGISSWNFVELLIMV